MHSTWHKYYNYCMNIELGVENPFSHKERHLKLNLGYLSQSRQKKNKKPEGKKQMEEDEAEIIEPFQLHYSDLHLLASSSFRVSSSSKEELQRLDSISRTLVKTLGPSGPGLLAVTGVPKASKLRRTLLPLARKLALLNNDDRRQILKSPDIHLVHDLLMQKNSIVLDVAVSEHCADHGLGTDVSLKNPDRIVSSFALQLKHVENLGLEFALDESIDEVEEYLGLQPYLDKFEFQDDKYKYLGSTFKDLGFCMIEIGLLLARVCDKAIGGRELEQSILDSGTAKGRLIYYHSTVDNLVLKEAVKRKFSTKGIDNSRFRLPQWPRESWVSNKDEQVSFEASDLGTHGNGARSFKTSLSNLWQQWHYDYGIFTVLTAPMFFAPCNPPATEVKAGICMSCEQECPPPDGHSYLQIFDPNKNNIRLVRSPPESFIVQVGESADILSRGQLHSTLHSVCRPIEREDLSRETFVVFLQPAWDKTFSISRSPIGNMNSPLQCFKANSEEIQSRCESIIPHLVDQETHLLNQEINKIVPPLSARLKDGMTFAEFSRQTTKQYYGGSGMQSKR